MVQGIFFVTNRKLKLPNCLGLPGQLRPDRSRLGCCAGLVHD
jgi:hypothetical protein